LFCGDATAYAYILESLRHYPDQSGVAGLLKATGWTEVRVTRLLGGVMNFHHAVRA
jgi:ubiquinone/menaquinone biosynthesis C-methylase UbiE